MDCSKLANKQLYARIVSDDSYFTGIQGYVSIPIKRAVPDPCDYINFYIGLTSSDEKEVVEAGVSYGHMNGNWHYFIHTKNSTEIFHSKPFSTQPQPGETVHLMLVNNGDDTVTLNVNGYEVYTNISAPNLGAQNYVKMVCAAADYMPNEYNVSHKQVNWSAVQVYQNGHWVNWDSNIYFTPARDPSGRYTIIQDLPLEATLYT